MPTCAHGLDSHSATPNKLQVFSVASGVWHTAAVAGQLSSAKFGILHTGKAAKDANLLEPQRSADSATSIMPGPQLAPTLTGHLSPVTVKTEPTD